MGLLKKTDYTAKITEIKDKIPSLTGLATTKALSAVENKIANASNLRGNSRPKLSSVCSTAFHDFLSSKILFYQKQCKYAKILGVAQIRDSLYRLFLTMTYFKCIQNKLPNVSNKETLSIHKRLLCNTINKCTKEIQHVSKEFSLSENFLSKQFSTIDFYILTKSII